MESLEKIVRSVFIRVRCVCVMSVKSRVKKVSKILLVLLLLLLILLLLSCLENIGALQVRIRDLCL